MSNIFRCPLQGSIPHYTFFFDIFICAATLESTLFVYIFLFGIYVNSDKFLLSTFFQKGSSNHTFGFETKEN